MIVVGKEQRGSLAEEEDPLKTVEASLKPVSRGLSGVNKVTMSQFQKSKHQCVNLQAYTIELWHIFCLP